MEASKRKMSIRTDWGLVTFSNHATAKDFVARCEETKERDYFLDAVGALRDIYDNGA